MAESTGATVDSPAVADGHQRMLALLERIRERTPDEHLFLGDAVVRDAQYQLANLDANAPLSERFTLLCRLGSNELRLGRNKEAVEHLKAAYDMLPKLRGQISTVMEESVIFGLAMAYLRSGETANCVHCHTSESCLFPIKGGGIHGDPAASKKAIEYFQILLKRSPGHMTARWLMNIASMTTGEYPQKVPERFLIPPDKFESEEPFPRFLEIAKPVKLNAFSLAGGSIADDFDGDGRLDIVVSSSDTAGQLQFFHNSGDGAFEDRTTAAGLKGLFGGLHIVQADYDNDDDLDILVLRGAWLRDGGNVPNSLLQNDGTGKFHDVTFEAGLGEVHFPTQTAAWADFDNDGDLDLYIGNEGHPNQLFENNGSGKFIDIAARAGVDDGHFTKGVVWGDYDGDRYPDLYVSNLDAPNRLYHNLKNGTFEDVAAEAGVQNPQHSFPTWFWDFNNDGALDLFVASYTATAETVAREYLGLPHTDEPDCLYQGDGAGGFKDVTKAMNLHRSTQPMGCNFGDLDSDGFPDFYLGTGDSLYEALYPNLLFHNRQGKGFGDVTTAAGMGHLQKGHGVAFADLDDDGDQDVFLEVGGAFAGDGFWNALFENPGFGAHWIKLKLRGRQSNRCAIGAKIHLVIEENGVERSVYKWVNSGSSFGANPLLQEIGIGSATTIKRLEIYWPTSDRTQVFENISADQSLEIIEGDTKFRVMPRYTMKFKTETPAAATQASAK